MTVLLNQMTHTTRNVKGRHILIDRNVLDPIRSEDGEDDIIKDVYIDLIVILTYLRRRATGFQSFMWR